eukprot:TRINITY_DN2945_c0_g2_i1.p1 TRINITY_DN2945_c0_g2~~TRINITY_DN2945_c0_g2_i1.p1  ORF type:complete len:1366 (+),score=392.81 TRINITY_DN2945_c0_g2_i1:7-4104(+)
MADSAPKKRSLRASSAGTSSLPAPDRKKATPPEGGDAPSSSPSPSPSPAVSPPPKTAADRVKGRGQLKRSRSASDVRGEGTKKEGAGASTTKTATPSPAATGKATTKTEKKENKSFLKMLKGWVGVDDEEEEERTRSAAQRHRQRQREAPFDKAEFYKQEAALTLDERRMRYATLDPVTLAEIPSWSQYLAKIGRLSDSQRQHLYTDAIKQELNWKSSSPQPTYGGNRTGFGWDSSSSTSTTSSSAPSSISESDETSPPPPPGGEEAGEAVVDGDGVDDAGEGDDDDDLDTKSPTPSTKSSKKKTKDPKNVSSTTKGENEEKDEQEGKEETEEKETKKKDKLSPPPRPSGDAPAESVSTSKSKSKSQSEKVTEAETAEEEESSSTSTSSSSSASSPTSGWGRGNQYESSSESSEYLEPPAQLNVVPNKKINDKVALWQGDITRLEIDGIVNAANEKLLGGGGIDGAIHQAAGRTLVKECALLNGALTGETKTTLGHNIPAKHILHTVGPRVHDSHSHKLPKTKLTSCYKTTMSEVLVHGMRSVAFCSISTGIFGYPLELATHAALQTIREWLEDKKNRRSVDLVILCVFSDRDRQCYEKLMQVYFPPVPPKGSAPVSDSSSSAYVDLSKDLPPPPPPPNKKLPFENAKRWKLIERSLASVSEEGVTSAEEFIALLSELPGNESEDFDGLRNFFSSGAGSAYSSVFFSKVVPRMARLIVGLPALLKKEKEKREADVKKAAEAAKALADAESPVSRNAVSDDRPPPSSSSSPGMRPGGRKGGHSGGVKFGGDGGGAASRRPYQSSRPQKSSRPVKDTILAAGFVPSLPALIDGVALLSRELIATLLACAFFGVFEKPSDEKEYHFSFLHLFHSPSGSLTPRYGAEVDDSQAAATAQDQEAKLLSLVNYFMNIRRVLKLSFKVAIRRKVFSGHLPSWEKTKNRLIKPHKSKNVDLGTYTDSPMTRTESAYYTLMACKQHPLATACDFTEHTTRLELLAFRCPEMLVIPFLTDPLSAGESLQLYDAAVISDVDLLPRTAPPPSPRHHRHHGHHTPSAEELELMVPKSAKFRKTALPADKADHIRTIGKVVMVPPVVEEQESLQERKYNIGRNLHRLYSALLPFNITQTGELQLAHRTQLSIISSDWGSEYGFWTPPSLSALLTTLVGTELEAAEAVLQFNLFHRLCHTRGHFDHIHKILYGQQVDLRHIYLQLVGKMPPRKLSRKEYESESARPPVQLSTWDLVERRFGTWKRDLRILREREEKERQRRYEMNQRRQRRILRERKEAAKQQERILEEERKEMVKKGILGPKDDHPEIAARKMKAREMEARRRADGGRGGRRGHGGHHGEKESGRGFFSKIFGSSKGDRD